MLLADFLDNRGWSNEDAAAMLAERGLLSTKGNPITPAAIKMMVSRGSATPRRWLEALEGSPTDETGEPLPPGDRPTTPKGRREAPPKRPAEATIQIVDPGASKRIAGAYRFAGAALAAGSGSQGVAHVWDDSADKIAELWIQAAAENEWAARFVNIMQAGGPMGDLAAGHLYLAGATLYVLGAGIPGGDAIFAKYSRFRPVERPPATDNGHAAEGEPEPAHAAAADPVVDGSG